MIKDKNILIIMFSLLVLMGISLIVLYTFMIFKNNYDNLLNAILNTIVLVINAMTFKYQYKTYKMYN